MAIPIIALFAVTALTLLMFPMVGLAVLPVAAIALLVLLAWGGIVLFRGPRALPEHTTRAPGREAPGRE